MILTQERQHPGSAPRIVVTPGLQQKSNGAAAWVDSGTVTDRFGFRHTSRSQAAVGAFERAVFGVAAHRPSTADDLAEALAAAPDLVAGHALKGFAQVILARQETTALAHQALQAAEGALASNGGGTSDEMALVNALRQAVSGRFARAAARLDRHLADRPITFLLAKIAHALRFMLGDAAGMLATTGRILRACPAAMPGYGFLLGCHAFALEELGQYDLAERIGRRAVDLEPEDAWGLHAVSHVHEMQGRVGEGIAWLEGSRPVWSGCNNFAFHMAWHLALFHLERADHERVLDLYDTQVRPSPNDDFRDVANAVSLLWRLEQEGVTVGRRWEELRDIALRRRSDTTLTFAALHYLLTLIAVGELGAARDLLHAIEGKAEAKAGDQADVLDAVGIELATVMLDLAFHRAPRTDLARLALRVHRLGGSNAQRDVFVRTLADIAANHGDRSTLSRILAARRRLKRDDRFVALLETRLAHVEACGRVRTAR